MVANPGFIDLDHPDPSASRHSSIAPSTLEEAVNPESAKDCVRYPITESVTEQRR
jgi:hypothetical protein